MYQYRIDFLKDSKGMNMGLVHVRPCLPAFLPACMSILLYIHINVSILFKCHFWVILYLYRRAIRLVPL
jgi:hypothetical protein